MDDSSDAMVLDYPVHAARPSMAGTYYGAMHRPNTTGELLIQFRCAQEQYNLAYRLYLPHACYLNEETIVQLDERHFGCKLCQRFHFCERDHRTCPVYEVNDEMRCWFSKRTRERVEILFEMNTDSGIFPAERNELRASLKDLNMPTLNAKHGKSHLLRAANALGYDPRAKKKLTSMADNHGRLKHAAIVIGQYQQQMKRTHVTAAAVEPEPTPEDAAVTARQTELAIRETVYHRDEYTRDNEFYIRYYRAIWSDSIAAAASRLYAKCCPSKQHDESVVARRSYLTVPTDIVDLSAVTNAATSTQSIRGLYAIEACPLLPLFKIEKFRTMVSHVLLDLVGIFMPRQTELDEERAVYYADRAYMLIGLFHPNCFDVWKWDEIVRYVLICIIGLFRQTLAKKQVIVWVADPWLSALPIQVDRGAFQRQDMQ